MGKGNLSNFKFGLYIGVSVPGAFKLIYLQPFEPILSLKIFIFSTFIPILCCPFLEETFLTRDEEFEQTSSTGGKVASGRKEEKELRSLFFDDADAVTIRFLPSRRLDIHHGQPEFYLLRCSRCRKNVSSSLLEENINSVFKTVFSLFSVFSLSNDIVL